MSDALVFAYSAWHVFSTMFVFLVGLWVAIAQKRLFSIGYRRALLFYFWHTAFCLFYVYFSLNNVADATMYYQRSLAHDLDFHLGTRGVIFVTSFFSVGLGLSYGGTFLVYNIIGFIGMLALASALQEVTRGASALARRTSLLLVLLPGLSFWSVAIGKDALTFMAAGLATWGALNLSRRYPALVVAILALLLARPHMAGILLASVTLALLFASQVGLIKKALLLLVALPSAAVALTVGVQFAGLGEATSAEDIAEYFAQRQEQNLEGGSSIDIAGMSVSMRLLTYLYRPFFFDASGLMGLVVSFENLVIVLVTLSALGLWLFRRKSQLERFPLLFFMVFSAAALFVLANTTANLGLALRQKWMFLPMLLVMSVSILLRPRRR